MKKILIIGASGSLARFVIEALKGLSGIQITLFVRNRPRLDYGLDKGCTVIEGDLEAMGNNIVSAMRKTHVSRIIAISSIGIYLNPLRPILMPYRKLADIIEKSGLIYTILRPDWFTNDDRIDYMLTQKGQPETGTAVSRKSIASFVAGVVEKPQLHQNQNLGISKPE